MRSANHSPPIESLAVIGDRRTAALLDDAGTVVWCCLPWYNSEPLLGGLVDAPRGGRWALAPREFTGRARHYVPRVPVHTTSWACHGGKVTVTDFCPLPGADRPAGLDDSRLLVRVARCTSGSVVLGADLQLAPDLVVEPGADRWRIRRAMDDVAWFASSHDADASGNGLAGEVRLHEGEEAWEVLAAGPELAVDGATCRRWLAETEAYWTAWHGGVEWDGAERDRVCDAASLVHLLSCAPAGATVAAVTTSLPERIGGSRNYDYRYSWIRDASLSLATLSMLGQLDAVRHYIDWITTLGSGTDAPLQVVYMFDGSTDIPEHEVQGVSGYRSSLPVRSGNRAYRQLQLDSLGYFVDCLLVYLEHGGEWEPHFWSKVRAAADFTADSWRLPDSGIWELPVELHWTASKVMSWTVLDRAIRILDRTSSEGDRERWTQARDDIREDVLANGWSDEAGSFVQYYGSTSLDGSLLLIPLMRFLPATDPHVTATVARIRQELERDRLVHRFDPLETPGAEQHDVQLGLGEFEGAFLPCTFWLASTLAMAGDVDGAEQVLKRAEHTAKVGIFAEEVDAATGAHLGNTPLLFSHAEYIRARVLIEASRDVSRR